MVYDKGVEEMPQILYALTLADICNVSLGSGSSSSSTSSIESSMRLLCALKLSIVEMAYY